MNKTNQSRPERPKLHLPLFLCGSSERTAPAHRASAFPLSPDQLRRTVAEMIG